jgi:hypothetical protein
MVASELIERMLVQISLGTSKENFGVPLDEEASALWDVLAVEVEEGKAAGLSPEIAGELPDLPEWTEQKSDGGGGDDRGQLPHQLQSWWEHGEGAAQIKWGTKGAFDRCVRLAVEHAHMTPNNAKGFCANRHYGALGKWPGQEHKSQEGEE